MPRAFNHLTIYSIELGFNVHYPICRYFKDTLYIQTPSMVPNHNTTHMSVLLMYLHLSLLPHISISISQPNTWEDPETPTYSAVSRCLPLHSGSAEVPHHTLSPCSLLRQTAWWRNGLSDHWRGRKVGVKVRRKGRYENQWQIVKSCGKC